MPNATTAACQPWQAVIDHSEVQSSLLRLSRPAAVAATCCQACVASPALHHQAFIACETGFG